MIERSVLVKIKEGIMTDLPKVKGFDRNSNFVSKGDIVRIGGGRGKFLVVGVSVPYFWLTRRDATEIFACHSDLCFLIGGRRGKDGILKG